MGNWLWIKEEDEKLYDLLLSSKSKSIKFLLFFYLKYQIWQNATNSHFKMGAAQLYTKWRKDPLTKWEESFNSHEAGVQFYVQFTDVVFSFMYSSRMLGYMSNDDKSHGGSDR